MIEDGFSTIILGYKIFLKAEVDRDDCTVIEKMFGRSLEPDKGYNLKVERGKYSEKILGTEDGVAYYPYVTLTLHMTPEAPSDLDDLAADISLEMMSLTGKVKSFLAATDMLPDKQEDEDEAAD